MTPGQGTQSGSPGACQGFFSGSQLHADKAHTPTGVRAAPEEAKLNPDLRSRTQSVGDGDTRPGMWWEGHKTVRGGSGAQDIGAGPEEPPSEVELGQV